MQQHTGAQLLVELNWAYQSAGEETVRDKTPAWFIATPVRV